MDALCLEVRTVCVVAAAVQAGRYFPSCSSSSPMVTPNASSRELLLFLLDREALLQGAGRCSCCVALSSLSLGSFFFLNATAGCSPLPSSATGRVSWSVVGYLCCTKDCFCLLHAAMTVLLQHVAAVCFF
ncbi:hypothetical protein VIGAN_05231900 [Vigna angularis var. angularis]|uniref:Uncharacterized protein n=1 Tax=Vigna angularis var. angularis TaxID=157739 RepID=A0A0S3S7E5_PHAAN|nr:hypothetical protein VIGAN_05231900 [Vigna angularis var. angularis]